MPLVREPLRWAFHFWKVIGLIMAEVPSSVQVW